MKYCVGLVRLTDYILHFPKNCVVYTKDKDKKRNQKPVKTVGITENWLNWLSNMEYDHNKIIILTSKISLLYIRF